MRTDRVRTAVVTTVAGRAGHLRRQRAALGECLHDGLHVVVGMGGRAPESPGPETVRLEVDASPEGLPLAAARNAGAAAALDRGADLLVFLDVDCIPGPDLPASYTAAARDGALLCGPVHYLPPAGPGGYPTSGLADLAPPHPGRPAPAPGQVVAEDRVELFWSLSFAVTPQTWRALGGFDEGFRGYGAEDTDFARRARDRGAEMFWVGGARAFHQHHPPARQDADRVAEIVRNARRFHRRWGDWPMRGWLEDLHRAGRVVFAPEAGELSVVARPAP
ncbi:galactosyltransferase-related protein [Pseudonocardia sp. WMMC193]|uniref:glycosyltransferase family 2 protein n=1 Tax=Pseudonocardia sp. WMMC193 TaxID=2911965 RepID=UPI001F275700|nr:galactosyltransferase-related protein [Pseudonocardia sp. WMMC193]MCF7549379.1 galactosyltransferase-related protein [Pseudonocardia sp. WMMC193]